MTSAAKPKMGDKMWQCDGCKKVYHEDTPLEDCECGCTSFTFVKQERGAPKEESRG